ncbi:MAG: hypothetical protein BRC24_00310 [Parcubacteria group bacterium SW_4_46_8]|nr:MAG: hypothetical protein BRC24_00310 [Parcubacteria group bacterium SW_4_46_8]
MHTKLAIKLGEVLAFCEVGIDTFKKGHNALKQIFSKEDLQQIPEEISNHRDEIIRIAEEHDALDHVRKKAQATGKKIESMQDLYLQDEDDWEDPAEMLEWLGFFEGGAIVHWSLVSGGADTADIAELTDLAHAGNQLHRVTLDIIAAYITDIGADTQQ